MKAANKGLSITKKFLLFIVFITLLAVTDSLIYINQSKNIEYYDDLNYRLNDVKFSMIKLEYILDMFVVARSFEGDKLSLITEDVVEVDKNIRELEVLGYTKFSDDSQVYDGIKYLVEDWHVIKTEFARLDGDLTYDAILLTHNTVDMNTILFVEKTEQLLADINETRKGVFSNIKLMVFLTLAFSLLLAFIATIAFMYRGLYPIRELAMKTLRLPGDEDDSVYSENCTGEALIFASALNSAGDTARKALRDLDELKSFHGTEIEEQKKQISFLRELSETAGESLSRNNIYMSAINGVLLSTGAEAAAIYFSGEDGLLHLAASSGVKGGVGDEFSIIEQGERLIDFESSNGAVGIRDIEDYPNSKFKSFLQVRRCALLVTVPILYDKRSNGVLLLEFKEKSDYLKNNEPFLRTIVSFIGAIVGYLNTFYKEYEGKSFLERIIDQSPLGLAVFDGEGVAIMLNSKLKRMLGVSDDSEFVGKYKIFEDNVLDREGVLPLIRESYEGLLSDAEFNYNPAHLTWYDFSGKPMKLKIKAFPLYDAGGEVSGIAILYDDMKDYATVATLNRRATDS